MTQKSPNLSIDPELGFLPHFSDAFVNYYDKHWVFVHAVADLLTERFKRVLVKAGNASEDSKFAAIGDVRARDALDEIIGRLERAGVEKPALVALQEATGRRDAGSFAAAVDSCLGPSAFLEWLSLVEGGRFEEAGQLKTRAGGT